MHNRRAFFLLVLRYRFFIEMLHGQLHVWKIFLEILWHVYLWITFIKLLIKINGAYAELKIIKIRGNLHHKIIRSHVAQQGNDTTLIKLHKFLSDTGTIVFRVVYAGFTEYISRNPHDMFFNQGFPIDQIIHLIRRKDLFQLQAVYTRCICLFDIEIVVYVIQAIDDPDAKWFGITKCAILYPIDNFMFYDAGIAGCF